MQFASIGARRRNADPAPWVLLDGTRSATDPVDIGNAEHWVTDEQGHALHLVHLADYAPREEFSPVLHNPTNPILDAARDTWDDPWGSAMAWGFAVCAALDVLEAPVPEEMGYGPSAWGSEADLTDGSYECAEVVSLLGMGTVEDAIDGSGPAVWLALEEMSVAEQHAAIDALTHAARVLSRYLDAARAAGLDY